MRVLLKTCLIGLGVLVLAVIGGLTWLFFDSRGLPDMRALAQFAPATVTQANDPCWKSASIVIPYDSIGDNLRSALGVAEAKEDGPGVLTETYRRCCGRNYLHRTILSTQISRTMFCTPAKPLSYDLKVLRVAVQLERRFSRRELFTILANRVWFSEDIVGVEGAAQHFFHKEPSQLLVGEAALLAGLVKNPSYFSPIKHPDRALQRRDEVIDAMAQTHAISESEASMAKALPLQVVTD